MSRARSWSTAWSIALFTAMFVSTTTGCGSLTTRSPAEKPQANLRQRCPDLQPLPDGAGATLLRWALAAVKDYRVCQDRVDRLVEGGAQ